MCRIAAFPPGYPKEKAHEIIEQFLGGNDDGVGSAYVKDGEFIVKKYPYSYKEALVKKDDLFEHMPYDGWTIAHIRMATHGGNTLQNTHPIIRGDYVGVHNGVFSPAPLLRAALDGGTQWSGETDSEVALYLYNKWGRDQFYKEMPGGSGVYVVLNRKGELDVAKTSGELRFMKLDNGTFLIASSLPFKWNDIYVSNGCYGFNPDGTPRDWKETEKKKTERYTRGDYGYGCGSGRQGRYYRSDIEEGTATTYPFPCNTHGPSNDDDTKSIIIIKNGEEQKSTTVERPSLWDWKTEQQILDYVRAMA